MMEVKQKLMKRGILEWQKERVINGYRCRNLVYQKLIQILLGKKLKWCLNTLMVMEEGLQSSAIKK